MQVHRLDKFMSSEVANTNNPTTHDDMVTACLLNHIGNKLGSNRCPALVFFVLPSVGKQRNNGSDSLCARNLAGVNHNAELHKSCVDSTTTSVYDIHIILAHGLLNSNLSLANAASSDLCLG